jgi:ribonucleoside-triphosphate reductase
VTITEHATLDPSFVGAYADEDPGWGFNGLGYVIYKRTYARPVDGPGSRLEEWHETVARCVNGAQEVGAGYTRDEAHRLYDHVFHMRGLFSGRFLWVGGTDMVRRHGGGALVNCVTTKLEEVDDFVFLFTMLMHGAGVGYSVERSAVHELPRVKTGVRITHDGRTPDADFIVADSREGWAQLIRKVLQSYFVTGESFSYSTILVREFGAALKTFGGTASGPGALVDAVEDICAVLDRRAGKKARSVDALDIGNIIGRAVVAGSARRSAQIAVGDPDDALFLRAKNWARGDVPEWRSQSNNSIFADSYSTIPDDLWSGYDGTGEPYGLINMRLARAVGRLGEPVFDDADGPNPCGEILQKKWEVCNLSEMVAPRLESLEQAVDVSRLLYKTQKAITCLRYPFEGTNEVVHKNRRLGQSVTGVARLSEEQWSWLSPVYEDLREFDGKWSAELGVNPSIKLTCVQPSGTKSLMPGVESGAHGAKAERYVRRVRFGTTDPLIPELRRRGYPVMYDVGLDGKENHTRLVVEFPCETPEGAVLEPQETAVQQLERVKRLQTVWADNAVSVSVGYRLDELPAIKDWLAANYDDSVKSVSFILREGHGFALAPIEPIAEEEYRERLRSIDASGWRAPEMTGNMTPLDESCEGGACPIR